MEKVRWVFERRPKGIEEKEKRREKTKRLESSNIYRKKVESKDQVLFPSQKVPKHILSYKTTI